MSLEKNVKRKAGSTGRQFIKTKNMIITFATQKGGAGKTTLAIAFANYISSLSERKLNVFDFDFQKSFFYKWKEDEANDLPKIYDVNVIDNDQEKPFSDFETLIKLKESKDINLFDLAGTLDEKYSDLLIYSDIIVIPFEYSDVSAKSTVVFINFLGLIESQAERVFIRSKYDKSYKYLNQEGMDAELKDYGHLLSNSVYKRNILQTINTRKLTYEQRYAVKNPFNELIEHINETLQITL
jgi:chromosome partitioning protein